MCTFPLLVYIGQAARGIFLILLCLGTTSSMGELIGKENIIVTGVQ